MVRKVNCVSCVAEAVCHYGEVGRCGWVDRRRGESDGGEDGVKGVTGRVQDDIRKGKERGGYRENDYSRAEKK